MKYLFRTIAVMLAVAVCSPTAANAADLQKAIEAYNSKDYATALIELRPLAEQGVAKAQSMLGGMFHYGLGVPKDYEKSTKWHKLAAKQGLAYDQVIMGWAYYKGRGVPQDDAEAVKWYRLSADQGNASAQDLLGTMYQDGLGVPEDFAEAVKWYRLSADKGFANAQYHLGYMYKHGLGTPQDYKTAIKWYTRAAGREHARAKYELGLFHEKGLGVPQNHKIAMKWYKLAAELGDVFAQDTLGDKYYEGNGVPQDYKTAFKWYTLAAEQGDTYPMRFLGDMYRKGQGVVQDYAEATKWYIKAFNEGDKNLDEKTSTALEELLVAYDTNNFDKAREIAFQTINNTSERLTFFILNLLVEINHPEDVELINQALENNVKRGDIKAIRLKTTQIYKRLASNPNLKTELAPQLFKLLRTSYAKGNTDAAVDLAWQYYVGELVPKDYGEALRLARKVLDSYSQSTLDVAERIICSITAENSSPHYNLVEARKFCKKSAERGNEWSQVILSRTYLNSTTEAEIKIGMDLLRQYSSEGNVLTMANLGWDLYSGKYGEFNSEEAFSLTKKAADDGVGAALNNLGVMYAEGIITPEDIHLAYQYYSKAAKKGMDYAHSNIAGGIFFRDFEGSMENFQNHYDAAIEIAEKAELSEGITGLKILGKIVQAANRLPKDREEAVNLLISKAIEGSAEAALQLAWNTNIAELNSKLEALKWFEISSRLARLDDVKEDAINGALRRSRNLSKENKKLVIHEAVSWLTSNGFNKDGTLPPSMKGTLTFLSTDGLGVTAYHVVRGCSNVEVLRVGTVNTIGRVLNTNSELDIAIVKVEQRDIPLLAIRAEEKPKQGESVSSFGYPTSAKDGGMASGIISATSGFNSENDEFQFSSPIQSGFSGGPVVDGEGQLLGIITKTLSTLQSGLKSGLIPQNANLAVKIDKVVELVGAAKLDNSSPFWKSWFSTSDIASSLKSGTATVTCNRTMQ
jgi:uncharacterized protein